MARSRKNPTAGVILLFALLALTGTYFTFAAVQGDFGLFRRVEIDAEAYALKAEHARLSAEVARLENLTRRMSDGFLDLDLLDEQARTVLGYARADEIVIN